MIYYFSATGNSKVVAEKLAQKMGDTCISIPEILGIDQYIYSAKEGESIGFIFPTFFFGVPTIVEEFIDKLELQVGKEQYVYLVLTCGGSTGEAGEIFHRLLKLKGGSLTAQFSVKMPDNYVPIYKIPDREELEKINKKADEDINIISRQIIRQIKGDKNNLKGFASKILTRVVYPVYKKGRKTAKFYAQDTCIHCGLCQTICPSQAIELEDEKPKWVKKQCALCLSCLHRCPVAAIQYGKRTEKHGQYLHPEAHL